MKLIKLIAFSLIVMAFAAFADDSTITVAAESSSKTYEKMLGEIIGVCSVEGKFAIIKATNISGGAAGNLQALVDNKVQAAFLHSDVYTASSQADPMYKRFQTLLALYPEPIHVLALRESKSKKLGRFEWGNMEFTSLADTKGYTIGAAGGGAITARILQGQGEGGFTVQQYDSGDAVTAALEKGEIAAAIFVGAAPLPNLEKLPKGTYKLLPIGDTIAGKVKGVYRVASVNYTGLTTGPVQTLAPMATVMTRKFNTPKRIEAQRNFRECFYEHLGELKDDASPNWQQVEVNDHGVLDWFEIPAAPGPEIATKK